MIPLEYVEDLYAQIKKKSMTKEQISKLKIKLCEKYGIKNMPTDIQLFLTKSDPEVKKILQTKPVRSISGVAPVAVMTRPHRCPHGKCTFCPGGIGSPFGDVPQSYTGKEPATMRGMRAGWDPYLQVFNRLEQYTVLGHVPEKTDVIVMGGTVLSVEDNYIEEFCTYVYKAMNDFSTLFYEDNRFLLEKFKEFFEMPGEVSDPDRVKRIQNKLLDMKGEKWNIDMLEEEQVKNETAKIRCIGLTIETKPDWGFLEHGNRMLKLGCTRVELGVQSTKNKPLLRTARGHTIQDNIKSIRELKDLGFKLNFHYMPGLPTVERKDELSNFLELFEDPNYRPDMLKIYPCMVMAGTPLYDDYKAGKFTPMKTDEAAELIAEFKRHIPRYCRVMRVQRDIPTYRTEAGVDRTNLRQYVDKKMEEKGIVSKEIRDREIKGEVAGDIVYETLEYDASDGKEFFIEAKTEDDKLLGYCRLRFPSTSLRDEIPKDSALVRELHVYGPALSIRNIEQDEKTQHKGIGRKLLGMAEEIATKANKTKSVVISGVGAREYYRKRGYNREGPYMVKDLR